jgi:hypothetical protein
MLIHLLAFKFGAFLDMQNISIKFFNLSFFYEYVYTGTARYHVIY